MISIEMLGDLRVWVDGQEVPDLPGQPIRCGLMVYLATERVSLRDPLLTLFWPERDAPRAKHSLSQTLYELSRVIGSDDWLDRRAERISVTDKLRTDVRDFEASLARESWGEALQLHRGPFLEGHHLAPTPEFEHWMEVMRARVERGFAMASSRQIARLLDSGAPEEALSVARRWAGSTELNENAELALIETLARSGQETEALQQFARYETRLSAELGASPSERMQSVVERIRSGRRRSTGGEVRSERAASARVSGVYEKLRVESQLASFRGRESQLSVLQAAATSVLAGVGSLVTISGPPGIGKTSLFLKFRQRVEGLGVAVHQTRCRPHRVGAPFFPVRSVLRDALGLPDELSAKLDEAGERKLREIDPGLVDDPATRAHLLGITGQADESERSPQDELLRAAVESGLFRIVVGLSRQRPRIFFLDDWQWSDEASHEALLALARRIHELPVVVVVGTRSSNRNAWRGVPRTEIELEPLEPNDVAALAESLLGAERLQPELLATLGNATGGNPFHIEEACRALQEGGFADGAGETRRKTLVSRAVSSSVDTVIRSRFDRLDPRAAEALELAAVLGAEISVRLLTQIADAPAALPLALKHLESLNLIRAVSGGEEPLFEFRHDITHDVALNAVPEQRSKEIHRKAALALEELHAERGVEPVVEEIAFHYAETEDVAKATQYLELAGDKARRSFSLADARKHYRRAIDLLDARGSPDARRIDLSFKLTEASIQAASSDLPALLERSRKAAMELRDKVREARALYWLGWAHYALGNQSDAKLHLRTCLEMLLSQEDERLLAQVYLNIGYSYAAATEYEEAVEYFRRGRQRRPIGAGKRSQGLAYAVGYEAMMLGDRGNFKKAHERLQEGMQLIEGLGRRSVEGSVRTQRAMVLHFQGDWTRCIEVAAEIRRIGSEIGSHYIDAISRTIDGYARFLTGDRRGLDSLHEAIRIMEASGALLIMSWNCACLADALALSGNYAEASRFAQRALDRGAVHDWLGEPTAHRTMARVAVLANAPDWGLFERHIQAALKRARLKGSQREEAITHLTAAELLAGHGRHDDARGHLVLCEPKFEMMEMSWYLDSAHAVKKTLTPDV